MICFPGSSFAEDHYKIAHQGSTSCLSSLGHYAIALLESIPILGGLFALIERVLVCVKEKISPPPDTSRSPSPKPPLPPVIHDPAVFTTAPPAAPLDVEQPISPLPPVIHSPAAFMNVPPVPPPNPLLSRPLPSIIPSPQHSAVPLDVEQSMRKMYANTRRAIEEATSRPRQIYEGVYSLRGGIRSRFDKKDTISAYAPLESALPSFESLYPQKALSPLKLTSVVSATPGYRSSMEDAHFITQFDKGYLIGVFDGHAGATISSYLAEHFPICFQGTLERSEGNIRQAFIDTIASLQQAIRSLPSANDQGSTAVISFIDPNTHLIYTATLGDSEANIYRNIDASMKSIPLSCVRDWSSPKDSVRANPNDPEEALEWQQSPEPKYLRVGELNVSRGFGDVNIPQVSQKAKITVNRLQPGDKLVFACDGLKDFLTEESIIKTLTSSSAEQSAEALVDFALTKRSSNDNITVVVCDCDLQ